MVEKWEKESSWSGKEVKVRGGRDKWKAWMRGEKRWSNA